MKAKKVLKKVKADYNKIAPDFSRTRNRKWDEFDNFLPYIKNNQNLIDLGCGNGRFLDFLKEHRHLKYTGIDNSSELLTQAQKLHPSANFILGDMLAIPEPDNSSDIIACIAAFHHLPDKKTRLKALEEMHRTLKENGILIITVWNLFQERYQKHLKEALKKSILSLGFHHPRDTYIPWSDSGVNRYYYAFKPHELEKLLKQSHFKILKQYQDKNFTYICQKS